MIGTTLSGRLLIIQKQSPMLSDIPVVKLVWWVVLPQAGMLPRRSESYCGNDTAL